MEALSKPKYGLQFHTVRPPRPVQCSVPEGFIPGLAESPSVLMRRLKLGQAVPTLSDGIFEDQQVFDTEMVDVFDVLDKGSEISAAVYKKRMAKPAQEESIVKPSQNGVVTPNPDPA